MKIESPDYGKFVKSKNKTSNFLIALMIFFNTAPFFVIVTMVGKVIDGSMTESGFLTGGLLIAVCLTLKNVFYGLSAQKAHESAFSVLTDIRVDIINHLKKMSLGFFQNRKAGELSNIVNHDVEQIELYLAHAQPEMITAILIPVISSVIILFIDWRMALSLISTVPVMLILNVLLRKIWASGFKKFADSTKKMSEDLVEYIATIPVIKAFSKEETKTRTVLKHMRDYLDWVRKMTLVISLPMAFISFILDCGLVLMIIVGATLLRDGLLDFNGLLLALILAQLFSESFAKMTMYHHYGIVFDQSIKNIRTILDIQPVKREERNLISKPGDIKIRDLNFSYEKGKPTLKNINLDFRKKTINAIIGSSGSGKTTLANMMMRFWDPDNGTVYIGGNDISKMSEKNLSSLVSIVHQEVALLNLSIEENIRIGKQDATFDEIIQAAKGARIHDFILSLPNGYDTIVGEAGSKLSGGEKQRISIARTILKNTPIIILDEATAAIDPNNEYLIQQAISNLGKDKTVIMIAHNLNSVKNVDQIVVMDSGRVSACGTHEELMKSSMLYENMMVNQEQANNWLIKEVTI
jgi:ATP-binding cassette subfamily B protein